MSLTLRPGLALIVAVLAIAMLIGASFSMAAAKRDNVELQPGFNPIGGPRTAISPDTFLQCIDDADWMALYSWDGDTQTWERYVNPSQVPSYVNEGPRAITTLTPGLGVVLIMDSGFDGPPVTLLDRTGESCS